MSNRLRGVFLVLLCALSLPLPAKAQSGMTAVLSPPNTDAFPTIEADLNIHDAQGAFVEGLQADQVNVLEDGVQLPVAELSEQRPGVQMVVAINPGPSFGVRNNKAISRFDILKETLINWAGSRQGSTLDDWSLLVTNSSSVSHLPNPDQWVATLMKDQVDARASKPSLDTLFRAVGLAADPTSRRGMGRAVLFITPPPEGELDESFENLSTQALQQGVSIFIWMVSSPGTYPAQAAERLKMLAENTGGKFFTYTGEETLPNPEEYFEPLRRIYRLAYRSQITTGGTHRLIAVVRVGVEQIQTNEQSFEINIQPPLAAFVSPPINIQRKLVPAANAGNLQDPSQDIRPGYLPGVQKLQIVFDFPDGRKRPIVQSVLLVDGVVTAENKQPPFDQFNWPLNQYTIDGTHKLQVQVKDVLGMTGASIEIPVQITVEQPAADTWANIRQNLPLLLGMAALVAIAVLLLGLIMAGKVRPYALVAARNRRRRVDPVTQPVQARIEPPSHRISGWVNRLQWPQRQAGPKANAFLNRISEQVDQPTEPPIPILSEEIILGSDPSLATLVVSDPSVEAMHARLVQTEAGSYRLADEGSVAGTWVNYTPISREGVILEHGDLIQIGRIGYRFSLRQPALARKSIVLIENESEGEAQEGPAL